MKNESPLLEPVATRLRLTEPALADNGFTAAVMVELPHSDPLPIWKKNTILLTATALGSAIVAWQVPPTGALELLLAATADWLVLMGTAVAVAYSAAIAAAWTTRKY